MSSAPPPILHQRYRILARLGQTRLAAVYRAHDERLQRPVIVHLLRQELMAKPALRQRFLEEARSGAQRSHPGLLEIYDSGEVGSRPYLVTEDLSGVPLAERVPLPLADALSVLRTVASAVALAQSQGTPHPPVSSRNVWLLDGGRAVLIENWQLSPQEAALDLAPYRAPERAQGAPPSPATTVYSLGILSWETITGDRPFTAPSVEAIVERQMREPLPSISETNPRFFAPGLDRVIQGAAAADPARRYPAPVDFGRALDLYVDQATAHTGHLELPSRPQPTPPRSRRPIFLRRGDTATAPAVQPSPALADNRGQPSTARAAAPAPLQPAPPVAPQATQGKQEDIGAVVQRAVRKAMWRQSCQRAIVKRSIQLALIVALIYAALVGIGYASDRARQIDPTGVIVSHLPKMPQLPDLSWLGRLVEYGKSIGGLAQTPRLVVTQPVNLRADPSRAGKLLRQLPVDTVLEQLEGPVDDATGGSLKWLKVKVVDDGTQGWIAQQPDRLRQQ
ncbi:MAG TPA: serine/threonine-protein kinase [Herpetosiphonaceae bacterium]|nr:serine/threonine-protein kinase [Herpetosiphonaceae bacterium]